MSLLRQRSTGRDVHRRIKEGELLLFRFRKYKWADDDDTRRREDKTCPTPIYFFRVPIYAHRYLARLDGQLTRSYLHLGHSRGTIYVPVYFYDFRHVCRFHCVRVLLSSRRMLFWCGSSLMIMARSITRTESENKDPDSGHTVKPLIYELYLVFEFDICSI